MKYYICYFLCAVFLPIIKVEAQKTQPGQAIVYLQNVEDFQPLFDNWKMVGDVSFDSIQGKAKISHGTGILVNRPTKSDTGHLFTEMEHGDIELELEFMMAKGSNAGVYLQGRYEIQMFDSWGVENPSFSDCGGIYQRWDESRPDGKQGYEGKAPAHNASKPPGEWQQFKIIFLAPRFNRQGEKTANARFLKVVHNGVVIHENVEVTGPTRSAAFEDEEALGPLMIQGDHGRVAIRNVSFKPYKKE